MKILDRYLIKQFLQTFLFGLLAFVLIFMIIDIMEKLDNFIDHKVHGTIVVEYYIYFMPEIIKLMIPVAVLLSALFTVGKLSQLNELAAIKSSGVGLYRFMTPFLLVSLLISLISIWFGGNIAPKANKEKMAIEAKHLNHNVFLAGSNIYFQDSKTRIVSIQSYDGYSKIGTRVSVQEFDPNDLTHLIERVDAIRLKYDTSQSMWIALDGIKRRFSKSRETASVFSQAEMPYLNFLPKDVISKQQKPEEMSLFELKEFIEDQIRSGNDPTRNLIEYHSRFAFGMASFICVLFGLPLSANKRRGGLALQFGINLLITFIYLGFMKISQAFGKNGVMNPILTAWFANIFFLVAAIINLIRVQK